MDVTPVTAAAFTTAARSIFFDLERIRNHLDALGLEMQMP